MDALGNKGEYEQMMTIYQESINEYEQKEALKQNKCDFLIDRLNAFYSKYSNNLSGLERQIVDTFNRLSGQYMTLNNRHQDLIENKKTINKQLANNIWMEESDKQDEEWVLGLKREGFWIEELNEEEEKLTVQD